MATLNKAAFEALYGTSGTTFPDNTTGEISESDMRQFGKDIADSLYNVSVSGPLTFVVIEIGDWNMDTDVSKNVAHGLTDFKKIRGIDVIIRNDSDTAPYHHFGGTDGAVNLWVNGIDNSNIGLSRLSSGAFDSASYDSTGYNRGWITITYQS